jgi:putative SOS response-associated peptidase YedK
VHNAKQRMPAVLAEADYGTWLSGSAPEAKETLRPYPAELMRAYQVGRQVNSPKLPNDARLIEPVASAGLVGSTGAV